MFMPSTNQLRNVNVTDGDDVSFSCHTSAQPAAAVVWFRNTRPLNGLYSFCYCFVVHQLKVRSQFYIKFKLFVSFKYFSS